MYRLYTEFAEWWPLLSSPSDYEEDGEALWDLVKEQARGPVKRLLELGSGGGHLVHHLPRSVELVLVDQSEAMLAQSRALNPRATHLQGDMRKLSLDERFDLVLLHDAVMYLTSPEDLQAALDTAADHLRPGGLMVLMPDTASDFFEETTVTTGHDHADGRGARLCEWNHSPKGNTFQVDFALMLKHRDGTVEHHHERHTMALFPVEHYVEALMTAGLEDVGVSVSAGLCFIAYKPDAD